MKQKIYPSIRRTAEQMRPVVELFAHYEGGKKAFLRRTWSDDSHSGLLATQIVGACRGVLRHLLPLK